VVPRPGEPVADSPQLIRAAQIELRRIGCFAGNDDGQFSEPTRNAVRRYLTQRGLPSSDLKISEAFLAELRAQDKGVCPLECKRGQVEDNGRCVAEPAAEPRRAKHSSPSKSERAATPRRERERTVKGARRGAAAPRRARETLGQRLYSNSPAAAAARRLRSSPRLASADSVAGSASASVVERRCSTSTAKTLAMAGVVPAILRREGK
jgi:peptidoglycan hydrolase-like protein with peptidoglycan-binding domain